MNQPTTAEHLREQYSSFFPLLHAADKACNSATLCGNGYLYRFADGSALRLATQHVEVIDPPHGAPVTDGYRAAPGEIATYSPDLSGGMLPSRAGRWVPAAVAQQLLESERNRAQALVTALERIVWERQYQALFRHPLFQQMQNDAIKAIEEYTGEPYPARKEPIHG
jgi:hypothetical protein